jgi:cytidylate kinase
MIVTVSGAPGSGTTTVAKSISEELGIRWVNSGDLFRNIAKEKNLSLKELGRLAETGPEIDYLIDDAQRAIVKDGSGVFEGRLSGHMLDADLKIFLKAEFKIRAERIAARENKLIDDALHECRVREKSEALRYEKYYNIDINDCSIYDIVIDTGKWDRQDVLDIVLVAVRTFEK